MMRPVTCWRLRRRLTGYADGELAIAERRVVERHLANCEPCRHRVAIERAVRTSLHDRTASTGSTAWLPRPELSSAPSTVRW